MTEAEMAFEAAVLHDGTDRMRMERLRAVDVRPDEVVVRIVAAGICHSDIAIRDGKFPAQRPIILGHEGAGIVEAVGAKVRKVRPGDRVVLTFASCGGCPSCRDSEPAYCHEFGPLNVSGRRVDGSTALAGLDGPVGAHFFGQSSFAERSIANERNVVKVRDDAPLELLGPFGCGIQTGAGAVLNSLEARRGQSLVVIGLGGVGLSAVMAGRLAGCSPIIVSDPIAERRELALELGASEAIDPAKSADLASEIKARTGAGADLVFDTSGKADVVAAAFDALGPRGRLGIVAFSSIDDAVALPLVPAISLGKTIKGICEGDSRPDELIPRLIDHFMAGDFPVDRLVTFYELGELDRALDDQAAGKVVKPVVRISAQ